MVKGFAQGNSICSKQINAGDLHLANYKHTAQIYVKYTLSPTNAKLLKLCSIQPLCLGPNSACLLDSAECSGM